LIDENMPRSLAAQIVAMGFPAQDVRDIGLRGRPDSEIYEVAVAAEAIIITRDRGFANERNWPAHFTVGVIVVNLPETIPAAVINAKITTLLTQRLPVSLLGAVTVVELRRALSRTVRRRS
jgi:predicted nuclease of predicted toxin-antitoxin system